MTLNTIATEALAAALKRCRERVANAIDARLPASSESPEKLHEAMRYAVLNGGKRVRASLVYMTGQALGAPEAWLDAPAVAVELIHAYSLVHDDLPSMDDDDLRRGQPTCHIAFDEATALLAGDALQTAAFEVLTGAEEFRNTSAPVLEMVRTLAHGSGAAGMAGGQAIDLASVGRSISLAELENMHVHKTGALIRSAVRLGALAGAPDDEEMLARLDRYAHAIGLAFQIQDDILDVVGETAIMGKQQGADEALNKPNYPALVGLERAQAMAAEQHASAMEAIAPLGAEADPLRWLSAYIVSRSH